MTLQPVVGETFPILRLHSRSGVLRVGLICALLSYLAQETHAQLVKPDPTCVCDPLCQIYPDESQPNSCGMQVPRSDCPCCQVCAGEEGEPCDAVSQPCDASKGLECNTLTNVCSVGNATVCGFEDKIHPVGHKFTSSDCEVMCRCLDNGATVCSPMECRPGFVRTGTYQKDPYCFEYSADRDNECCSLFVCQSESDQESSGSNEEFSISEAPPNAVQDSSEGFIIESTPQTGRILFQSPSSSTTTSSTTSASTTTDGESPTEGDAESTSTPSNEPPSLSVEAEVALAKPPTTSSGSNLEFLQITPTSIQVQFPGITGGNLMYVEERLYRGGSKPRGAHSETPWENAIILEGNEIFTLTGLDPGTKYRLRWQAPEEQFPDVMVSTHAYNSKQPKVIIIGKSYDGVTLSFDHFAPDEYEHGYVAMYKEKGSGRWESQQLVGHEEVNGFDLPSITIKGLEPSTEYTARISIYEDFALRSFGKSTGTIDFLTDLGCMHQNQSYPVGVFTLGCEATCQCNRDGSVVCGERCHSPLHRSGAWADDPLCVEQFVDGDDCCVVITCAGNAEGENPEGPCSGITCGPNSECRHEVFRAEQAAETICVCKDGFTGDPDSAEGCASAKSLGSSPASAPPGQNGDQPGCQEKSGTFFAVGEKWFDGCDYQCTCSSQLEVVCQPRCKPLPEASEDKCELRADPEDECCKVMYCPDPNAVDDNDELKPVALPFDGCLFKNESYKQGERFYDGCEQQCQCMGYGDMVCLSRCPPTAPAPGQNCYTLPDASDPCCNITVCDKPILDPSQNVPKEDITIEEVLKDDSETTTADSTERVDVLISETTPVSEIIVELADSLKQSRIVNAPEFTQPISGSNRLGLFIGNFENHHHGISGEVYALNDTNLLIKDFTYDGSGPDAFFWMGTNSDSPDGDGTILPYPFEGEFFDYNDLNAPVLGRFDGSQEEIILQLPDNVEVGQIKWLSVWCRAFSANFGHLKWPNLMKTNPSGPPKIPRKEESEEKPSSVCLHKNEAHELGSEFHDGCDAFCMCTEDGSVLCHDIKCPSRFGLDVINPFCLKWDEHKDFEPQSPMCCPPAPVCQNDGSCMYEGEKFNNYDNIPANLTGCEDRCFCENGEVMCQKACYELEATPPNYLSCNPALAIQIPQEERPCCRQWGCPDLADLPKTLDSVETQELNATAIQFNIKVPRILDGMSGFYEVYYSSGFHGHPDASQWPRRIITPPQGKLSVSENEIANLILTELLPETQYFLKVDIHVRKEDEPGEIIISSDIKSAKTLPIKIELVETTIIPLDVGLNTKDITAESTFVSWRIFTSEEKQYIDGVQIRYVVLNGDGSPGSGVPGTSPFIHRDTNFFTLEDLKADTEYQIDLYVIPIPKAEREYFSKWSQKFRTEQPVQDPYQFDVNLDPGRISGNSLELVWSGIPNPHQEYVNLYRILYTEDNGEPHHPHLNSVETQSVFKIAKIDSTKSVVLRNLKPLTKYQVWLEAYLRNGKVFQSNVLDVRTTDEKDAKAMASPSRGSTSSEAGNSSNSSAGDDHSSYYNGMVVAAIIAAFAILALFVVTALYLKRTTTYKAIISGHRGGKSQLPTNEGSAKANRRVNPNSLENGNNSLEMNGINGNNKKP